ncbi:MAG: ThiF family adenylyltransferase [Thermomicrobiales bacterium]
MDRYDRQRRLAGFDQEILSAARILVIGAGTTGNEVIKNLVLLGVGHLTICDVDTIETVNLSRSILFRDRDLGQSKATVAADRALELNPDLREAVAWHRNVVHEVGCRAYEEFACVVLTVDNLEARMWVNRYCWLSQTPLIDTGVHGLLGNISVMAPPAPVCLECGWSLDAYRRLAERFSCLKIGLDPNDPKIPMVITSAAVIGGLAAQECVGLLHDRHHGETTRGGTCLSFDGEVGALLRWHTPERDDCPGHGATWAQRALLDVDSQRDEDVASLKARIQRQTQADIVELYHDKEIVYGAVCNACEHIAPIAPVHLGMFRRRVCTQCGSVGLVPHDVTTELRQGFTLGQLGVPCQHVIRIMYARGEQVDEAWCPVR